MPFESIYKGHRIDVQLLVDGHQVDCGRFPNGDYFLREYAYEWSTDLMELAVKWIDHREAEERRGNPSGDRGAA